MVQEQNRRGLASQKVIDGLDSEHGLWGWWAWMVGLVALMMVQGCSGFPSASGVCHGGAKMDVRGRCVVEKPGRYRIPFREGSVVRVTQGMHGYASHRDSLAYAVDFACEEGEPIVASRAGIVWEVAEESNRGCGEPECVRDANYVILDHGDGTYGSYYHLRHKGALVEVGEQVCEGQLIGLCGNTGYSTGAHLHFEVSNSQGATIPVPFEEAAFRPGGVLLPREHYRSENQRAFRCGETSYSRIGRAAFAHRGVMLREEVSTVVDEEATMRLRGHYSGEMTHVAIHRRAVDTEEWEKRCERLDRKGRFDVEITWDRERFSAGQYFLMVTGSDERCSAPGWAWSYRIKVQ